MADHRVISELQPDDVNGEPPTVVIDATAVHGVIAVREKVMTGPLCDGVWLYLAGVLTMLRGPTLRPVAR
jgi:hypothetical protein